MISSMVEARVKEAEVAMQEVQALHNRMRPDVDKEYLFDMAWMDEYLLRFSVHRIPQLWRCEIL